jgi:hypothetical protein
MRFKPKEVAYIRDLYSRGVKVKSLAALVDAPLSVVFACATNRTYFDAEYAKQIQRRIPLDVEYCRKLRSKNYPISKIIELEQKKSKRKHPLSNELIRLRLTERKPR